MSPQVAYIKDMIKTERYGAMRDEQGRFLVYITYGQEFDTAYFFDTTKKRRRISATTFDRWLDEDRAVEVDPADFKIQKPKENS